MPAVWTDDVSRTKYSLFFGHEIKEVLILVYYWEAWSHILGRNINQLIVVWHISTSLPCTFVRLDWKRTTFCAWLWTLGKRGGGEASGDGEMKGRWEGFRRMKWVRWRERMCDWTSNNHDVYFRNRENKSSPTNLKENPFGLVCSFFYYYFGARRGCSQYDILISFAAQSESRHSIFLGEEETETVVQAKCTHQRFCEQHSSNPLLTSPPRFHGRSYATREQCHVSPQIFTFPL